MKEEAKNGDKVRVHYTGTLDDGTVFDSSVDREPLEFVIGDGQVIPGFEKAVLGLKAGEKTTIAMGHEEAYGPRIEEMVFEVEREKFPKDYVPEVDQQLQIPQEDGDIMIVTVVKFTDKIITLDANHPLAGQNLNFEVELVEIV